MTDEIEKQIEEAVETMVERALGPLEAVPEMRLDLTKGEKVRVTALYMAVSYHVQTIVKDAAMYSAMTVQGKHLEPSQVEQVVEAAVRFEEFILGRLSKEPEVREIGDAGETKEGIG